MIVEDMTVRTFVTLVKHLRGEGLKFTREKYTGDKTASKRVFNAPWWEGGLMLVHPETCSVNIDIYFLLDPSKDITNNPGQNFWATWQ